MLELRGHKGPVLGLAFSPDGKTLASASADGSVRLWDVASGSIQQTVQSGEARAYCVAFSKQGRRLAVGYGGDHGLAQIWELNPFRRVENWVAHTRTTRGIAFGFTGEWMVTCGDRPIVAIWDLPLQSRHSVTMESAASALALAPDRRHFATLCTIPLQVRFWEQRRDLISRRSVSLNSRSAHCVAFSPTEKFVACGLDGEIAIASPERRGPPPAQWKAHESSILGIAYSPNGQSVFSAGTDGTVKSWDLSGTQLLNIDWQIGELGALAIAPDGLTAAVGGAENFLIWDLES